MAGACAGRTVIVTGAGGGIGRCHALLFAAEGARVVVNDVGSTVEGRPAGLGAAEAVVSEIEALGGEAVASRHDVADFDQAEALVGLAVESFGNLDVVVNNAGIVRDRMLFSMSADEWDAVIRVHLGGTFAVSRHAAAFWRTRAKAGSEVDARIINTSSASGLYGNVGQSNYGAAKAGIAALTVIASQELGRYGVTVNAIAPYAHTRMTKTSRRDDAPVAAHEFDEADPANISPLVAWLGSPSSRDVTGRVFNVRGGYLSLAEGWANGPEVDKGSRWTIAELDGVVGDLVSRSAGNADIYGNRSQVLA